MIRGLIFAIFFVFQSFAPCVYGSTVWDGYLGFEDFPDQIRVIHQELSNKETQVTKALFDSGKNNIVLGAVSVTYKEGAESKTEVRSFLRDDKPLVFESRLDGADRPDLKGDSLRISADFSFQPDPNRLGTMYEHFNDLFYHLNGENPSDPFKCMDRFRFLYQEMMESVFDFEKKFQKYNLLMTKHIHDLACIGYDIAYLKQPLGSGFDMAAQNHQGIASPIIDRDAPYIRKGLKDLQEARESVARKINNLMGMGGEEGGFEAPGFWHSEQRLVHYFLKELSDESGAISDFLYDISSRLDGDEIKSPVVLLHLHSARNLCITCRQTLSTFAHDIMQDRLKKFFPSESLAPFRIVCSFRNDYGDFKSEIKSHEGRVMPVFLSFVQNSLGDDFFSSESEGDVDKDKSQDAERSDVPYLIIHKVAID